MARRVSRSEQTHMKLRDALGPFEDFLRQRLIGDAHRAVLLRILKQHLFPRLGSRLLHGVDIRRRLPSLIASLALPVADLRYALNNFHRYVSTRRHLGSLGEVIDRFLRHARRRGRTLGSLGRHRTALGRLSSFVAAECELGPRSRPAIEEACREIHAERDNCRSSAVRHFGSFLAMNGHLGDPPTPSSKLPAAEQRLVRRIPEADHSPGLDGALSRYLRELRDERQLSLPHILNVQARCTRFLRDMEERGRRRPREIRREDVAAYRDRSVAAGITRTYKDLSILRGFFGFLARRGEVDDNPVEGVSAKIQPRTPRTALTLPELQALLAAPEQDLLRLPLMAGTPSARVRRRFLALRDRAALALLAETGVRPSELLSLTVDDIQAVPGMLRIEGKGSRATPKRSRCAYLESRVVLQALRDYLAVRPIGPHRALLLSAQAEPLALCTLVLIVARRARQAGLRRPVRPYDLRVTFASRLVARGADLFALRVLMGHDDIRTTLSLYTALSLEEVREVWRETNPLAPPPPRPGDRT